MHIRPGTAADAGLISDLAFRSKAYWGYDETFMAACREELTYSTDDLASMQFAIAETGGRVVGFYALKTLNPTEVELDALFLEPDVIGQGLGRTLLAHAKFAAATSGAKRMIVQGDPNAEAFYVTMGGVVTGTRESDSIPGRHLPTFCISLDSPA